MPPHARPRPVAEYQHTLSRLMRQMAGDARVPTRLRASVGEALRILNDMLRDGELVDEAVQSGTTHPED